MNIGGNTIALTKPEASLTFETRNSKIPSDTMCSIANTNSNGISKNSKLHFQ